jgi:hypothetical protein
MKKRLVRLNHTAYNERFHASGGVACPKGSANLQVLYPAQTVVSRRLREAATALSATVGKCSGNLKRKNDKIKKSVILHSEIKTKQNLGNR